MAKNKRNFGILHSACLFWICASITLTISGILGFLPIPFIRYLQKPEISLAWFAILWVLVAWFQSYGGVWSVMAMTDRNSPMRKKLIPNPLRHRIFSVLYWFALVFMVFVGVQLAIGTFKGYNIETSQNAQIQSLIDQNRQLIERLDKLILQMEANDGSIK